MAVVRLTAVECRLCGIRFEWNRKVSKCPACKRKNTCGNCAVCGKFFRGRDNQKTCSLSCGTTNRYGINWERTCEGCGKSFEKRRNGQTAGRFCSRQCAFDNHSKWHQPGKPKPKSPPNPAVSCSNCGRSGACVCVSRPNLKECRVCGVSFPSKNGRLVCSPVCTEEARKRSYEYRYRPVERAVMCKTCGATFIGNGAYKYCSKACRPKTRESHAQRAKRHGGKVEFVDPAIVFRRARYQCEVCGVRCRLITHSDEWCEWGWDMPTLDHIIPLSRIGDHTYENCRCLCRACNTWKGDQLDEDVDWDAVPYGAPPAGGVPELLLG